MHVTNNFEENIFESTTERTQKKCKEHICTFKHPPISCRFAFPCLASRNKSLASISVERSNELFNKNVAGTANAQNEENVIIHNNNMRCVQCPKVHLQYGYGHRHTTMRLYALGAKHGTINVAFFLLPFFCLPGTT